MKIIKSTEKEGCRSLVRVGKKEEEKQKENKTTKILAYLAENKRRAVVVMCSMLLIVGAIILNWRLFGVSAQEDPSDGDKPVAGDVGATDPSDNLSGNMDDETYFALAVIERQRARDESIRVLQNIVDSNDVSDTDRKDAVNSISKIADDIRFESSVMTMLKAKGFEDCIAVIDNGKASIVIGTKESLTAAQIAQVTDIVYRAAGIPPTNIVITERKS